MSPLMVHCPPQTPLIPTKPIEFAISVRVALISIYLNISGGRLTLTRRVQLVAAHLRRYRPAGGCGDPDDLFQYRHRPNRVRPRRNRRSRQWLRGRVSTPHGGGPLDGDAAVRAWLTKAGINPDTLTADFVPMGDASLSARRTGT